MGLAAFIINNVSFFIVKLLKVIQAKKAVKWKLRGRDEEINYLWNAIVVNTFWEN